jgi:hypothetical protein
VLKAVLLELLIFAPLLAAVLLARRYFRVRQRSPLGAK